MPSAAIVWHRRDLRVHDHPALATAAREYERVLPVFVLDDRLLHGRFASASRTAFMLGCLRALDEALRERGSALSVRHGEPERVLPELAEALLELVARVGGVQQQDVGVEVAPHELPREGADALAAPAPGGRLHLHRRQAPPAQVGRQHARPPGGEVVALGVALDVAAHPPPERPPRRGLARLADRVGHRLAEP